MPPAPEILAIAVDYDRTLTTIGLEPVAEALDMLARARALGLKVIVVSGRTMAELEAIVGGHVDALVAENGALWRVGQGKPHATHATLADVRHALDGLDLDVEFGEVLASADAASHDRLVDHLRGKPWDIVRNRDRVMVLPQGVDKAVGLLAVLRALGIDAHACVALGDGENDVPMLRAVGHGIAVGNAVPQLKDEADEVLELPGGEGVAQWVKERWAGAGEVDA